MGDGSEVPGDGLVDPAGDRPLCVALVDKYSRMIALRASLGRGTPSHANRVLLRSLAAEYPGALRELEVLPTDHIESRLAVARAAESGLVPEWLIWTARYHARMRDLMVKRRAGARSESGRMNVTAFRALAADFGVPIDVIWQRLFPSITTRPHRHG